MKEWLSQLFCWHDYSFHRDVTGTQTEYKCRKCQKIDERKLSDLY